MIYAQEGAQVTASLEGAPENLAGTLGFLIRDPATDEIILTRTTAGIDENDPGVYDIAFTAPSPGTYRLRWDSGADPLTPDDVWTEELQTFVGPPPELPPVSDVPWIPTLSEVAGEIRARTYTAGGTTVGTFNADTVPTAEEAAQIVVKVTGNLASRVGEIPETLYGQAKDAATLEAAARIERTYFPEQVRTGKGTYPELRAEADAAYRALLAAVGQIGLGSNGRVLTSRPLVVADRESLDEMDVEDWVT